MVGWAEAGEVAHFDRDQTPLSAVGGEEPTDLGCGLAEPTAMLDDDRKGRDPRGANKRLPLLESLEWNRLHRTARGNTSRGSAVCEVVTDFFTKMKSATSIATAALRGNSR